MNRNRNIREQETNAEKIKKYALNKDNMSKIKGSEGGRWVLIDGKLIWIPN